MAVIKNIIQNVGRGLGVVNKYCVWRGEAGNVSRKIVRFGRWRAGRGMSVEQYNETPMAIIVMGVEGY